MLKQRTIVALILAPITLLAVYYGGVAYIALITTMLIIAAWEYTQLLRSAEHEPAPFLIIGGVLLLILGRVILWVKSLLLRVQALTLRGRILLWASLWLEY